MICRDSAVAARSGQVVFGSVLAGWLLALAVAGCGGGGHKQRRPAGSTRTTSTTTGSAAKPIVTVDDDADGSSSSHEPMRVSIYDLRRTGPFLTLDFGIVCTTPNPGCETSFLFAAPTATAMSVYSLNSLQAQKVSEDTANGIRLDRSEGE